MLLVPVKIGPNYIFFNIYIKSGMFFSVEIWSRKYIPEVIFQHFVIFFFRILMASTRWKIIKFTLSKMQGFELSGTENCFTRIICIYLIDSCLKMFQDILRGLQWEEKQSLNLFKIMNYFYYNFEAGLLKTVGPVKPLA